MQYISGRRIRWIHRKIEVEFAADYKHWQPNFEGSKKYPGNTQEVKDTNPKLVEVPSWAICFRFVDQFFASLIYKVGKYGTKEAELENKRNDIFVPTYYLPERVAKAITQTELNKRALQILEEIPGWERDCPLPISPEETILRERRRKAIECLNMTNMVQPWARDMVIFDQDDKGDYVIMYKGWDIFLQEEQFKRAEV